MSEINDVISDNDQVQKRQEDEQILFRSSIVTNSFITIAKPVTATGSLTQYFSRAKKPVPPVSSATSAANNVVSCMNGVGNIVVEKVVFSLSSVAPLPDLAASIVEEVGMVSIAPSASSSSSLSSTASPLPSQNIGKVLSVRAPVPLSILGSMEEVKGAPVHTLAHELQSQQSTERKRGIKASMKQRMVDINYKRLNEIDYKPPRDHGQAFEELKKEDLHFNVGHDDFVWASFKKYKYSTMNSLKVAEKLKLASGIIDEESAKKFLGSKINNQFILVRDSVTYFGKNKEWQNLCFYIALELARADRILPPRYQLVPIRVSSVADILPYEARVAIMSLLAHDSSFEGSKLENIQMPSRYLRYAAIPGSDLSNATKEDVDEMRANVKALTTGWLYGRKPIEYAPEKLSGAVFFFEGENKLNTDCLVHAVNYALRFPFFVQREQVMRLGALRIKINSSIIIKKKCDAGVAISAFTDFAVVAGNSLSLRYLKTFDVQNGDGSNTLKAFILSKMLDDREFSELIIIGKAMGIELPFSHSCSFVAIDHGKSRYLAYCDCQGKDAEWYPTIPRGQTGPKVNFNDEFDKFQVLDVYCIQQTVVNKKEAEQINNAMTYIMTGEDDYIKQKQVESASITNKKRKNKGW